MRTVRELRALHGIPVLVRASLNAPVVGGKVTNTFRLESALPTISFLKERGAKVILASHVSGTGTETLFPVFEAMRTLVPGITFCSVPVGAEARRAVRELSPGGVLMLENLRRMKGEEQNDSGFAHELASLADIFVQDSFDVCHRKHASVIGVPKLLPAYAGLTVEVEVDELTKALHPKKPSLAIIAGAKFATKEPVLRRLLKTYDRVVVGGALANDFIHAAGYDVGASLVSKEALHDVKALVSNKRLVVPKDVIVAKRGEKRDRARVAELSDVQGDEMILDLGPKTQAVLAQYARKAKTVTWNGPLGLFEDGFTDATYALARAVVEGKAHSVVGGGDTISALETLRVADRFSFISTGGGAMLDFLAEGTLPGLSVL